MSTTRSHRQHDLDLAQSSLTNSILLQILYKYQMGMFLWHRQRQPPQPIQVHRPVL